jgi:OPA family glycerol-3-phosphate transporter-like MFS transporter
MDETRTRTWQKITLATLFTGYAGYYICRSNLSVATPLMLEEFASSGLNKEHFGTIASAGVLLYAVGKISNGLIADFFGGRIMFLLGMAVSVLCTVLFGLAGGLTAFVLIWAVNRYFQSMGWVALVKISSRWYPVHIHATMLGILSMSYLLGDAFARLYLGSFIKAGVGWKGIFFIAAGTLGCIALVNTFFLKSSPKDIGGKEPPANPENVFGEGGNKPRPENLWKLLRPLFCSFPFWVICVLNIGLTLIRETFNFWTPTYLKEMVGLDVGSAALYSMLFPTVGALSAFLAGFLSDRLEGKHGRVCVPSLILLIGALIALYAVPVQGKPNLAILLVCLVSLFLIAPYSFLSGVMALDFGGKRGTSTAAGLIDSAGYFGAVLSGWGIGRIAERSGWGTALIFLVIVATLSLAVAVTYWIHQERL